MSVPALWALVILAVLVAIIIIRRYYIVSDSNVAILRSGLRGAKVYVSKGALVLPFLQHADFIPLRTININLKIGDDKALLTSDQLRIDLHMDIDVRVAGTVEDVQRAARTIGARQINEEELTTLLGGRLIGLIRNIGATFSFNDLHFKRDAFCDRIREKASGLLAENGMLVDAVAVVHLDQTPAEKLSDRNIMDAGGLSHITRLTSEKRKERAQIEADVNAEIRKTELSLVEKQLDMDRKEQEARTKSDRDIARLQAERDLHLAQTREQTEQKSSEVKIKREEAVRQAEIAKDLSLRHAEIKSLNEMETAKITATIKLTDEQKKQIAADVELEKQRAGLMRAQEGVQSERERLVAERAHEQHILKTNREREGDIIRTNTEAENTMKIAKAEADAHALRKAAEAEGAAKIIAAENSMDNRVMVMKLEDHKIRIMPEIAGQMSKSLEKIEGIRINMLSGFPNGGGHGGGEGGRRSGPQSVFSSAIEDILAMSVQLPALQKIGAQVGVDMDTPVATRISDAAARVRPSDDGSASAAGDKPHAKAKNKAKNKSTGKPEGGK